MSEQGASRSKVARLIDRYGMEGMGDELVERWTRTEDRHGLRQLAEEFNHALLEAALEGGQADPLDGEVENLYRLLTDEEVSSGVRTQARNRLDQAGVDVERLESDFVSYQAIYTYLREYRGVEPPEKDRSDQARREKGSETIQQLTTRLAAVTERTLEDLRSTGRLTLGEFNVLVSVRVHCTDCGTQTAVTELLSEGGCDCRSDRE